MVLEKHCWSLPRMLQTEIGVHCTLVWMLPRNNKNQKNSVPIRKQNFVALNLQATVFIFRQAQFSIILSCKWMYCMYDFFLVIIYCRYGCGNNVHVKCMKVWAEHQRSTGENIIKCPLCRVDFGSFQVCKPGKRIICSINDLQLNDFPASYFQQWDVYKTWTSSPWTTPVDLLHGPLRGPSPWSTHADHP